jgi:hypothetical protein
LKSAIHFVAGVVVLVAAIAVFAPAALLDLPLAAHTQQRLRLVDATGRWWRGHGVVTSADGTARMPVSWQLDAAAFARGAIAMHVGGVDDAEPRAAVAVAFARTDVRALHARIPASFVSAFDRRLQVVALGGSIVVDAPSLSVAGNGIAGAVDAKWANARVVAGDTIVDLGSVSLTTNPATQPPTASIRNAGGDVSVDGTIIDRGSVIEGSVVLRPAPTASVAVRNALSTLGASDATGAVRITWRDDR